MNLFFLKSVFLLSFFFINGVLFSQATYDHEVRCLGRELDGSLTLEAYGKGRNRFDASEQAKKEAVYSVIFKGIKAGNGGCESLSPVDKLM